MATFRGNKRKINQKGHLNCSIITQPANTELSPRSLPLGDVLRGGTYATQRQKLHTDHIKSVQNLVISTDWTTESLHPFSKDIQWNNQLQLMKHDVPQFQGFAFVMNGGTCATQRAMNAHVCTIVLSNYNGSRYQGQNVAKLSGTFVTFALYGEIQ